MTDQPDRNLVFDVAVDSETETEQGRIHGYVSRVRVGWGNDEIG